MFSYSHTDSGSDTGLMWVAHTLSHGAGKPEEIQHTYEDEIKQYKQWMSKTKRLFCLDLL